MAIWARCNVSNQLYAGCRQGIQQFDDDVELVEMPTVDPPWLYDVATKTAIADTVTALADLRAQAVSTAGDTGSNAKVLRGVLLAAVEEVNLMRQRDAAWKTAVANATSLANLKVLIAALPDLPDRTAAQAKTAVVNKINSGDAD